MAATLGKAFERFFYDFSLYEKFFAKSLSKDQYIALRHNALLTGGFYTILSFAMPFNPPFPTMGLCPGGYEGTWVCETNRAKAFDMYKEWKETGKWKPAKAAAPAADKH